mmetsp:Transcript_14989/g.32505  ORF Transcript_14989/g.32505 Transcript_14989/m.32505 type:complete len:272 (-) Transcript_14989:147-962(-)
MSFCPPEVQHAPTLLIIAQLPRLPLMLQIHQARSLHQVRLPKLRCQRLNPSLPLHRMRPAEILSRSNQAISQPQRPPPSQLSSQHSSQPPSQHLSQPSRHKPAIQPSSQPTSRLANLRPLLRRSRLTSLRLLLRRRPPLPSPPRLLRSHLPRNSNPKTRLCPPCPVPKGQRRVPKDKERYRLPSSRRLPRKHLNLQGSPFRQTHQNPLALSHLRSPPSPRAACLRRHQLPKSPSILRPQILPPLGAPPPSVRKLLPPPLCDALEEGRSFVI